MSELLITSTAYFPPLSWYYAAGQCGAWLLESQENFQKGGYRNRCRIATANGVRWLSVPLEKGKHQGSPIRSVKISYTTDWVREHTQSIQSAYGRAPYFEFYSEPIFTLLHNKPLLLWSLNEQLLALLNGWLSPPVPPRETTEFKTEYPTATSLDWRYAKAPASATLPPYPQLFADRHGFQGELSILDLLFCQGPAAANYLRNS